MLVCKRCLKKIRGRLGEKVKGDWLVRKKKKGFEH